MTVIFTDNFNGTAGSQLIGHTSDSGHGWARNTSYSASGLPLLKSGTAVQGAPGISCGCYTNLVPASADYTVTAVVKCYTAVVNDTVGVTARGSSTSAKSFYRAQYIHGTGWILQRTVAGTSTQIGTTYTGVILSAGVSATLDLIVSGTTITMQVNGVAVATGTDSTYAAAGTVGLIIFTDSQVTPTASTNLQIESLVVDGVSPSNNVPNVVISNDFTPNTGFRVPQGRSITLRGVATDVEDGFVTGAGLAWSSNLDGALGTGATLTKSNLSIGTHNITLSATDSGGATGTSVCTVIVGNPAVGNYYDGFVTYTPIGGTPKTAGYVYFIPANLSQVTPICTFTQVSGSGSSGTDNTSQLGAGGADQYINSIPNTFPDVMLFPQYSYPGSPYGERESGYLIAQAVVTEFETHYSCNPLRRYLFGHSLGGFMVVELLVAQATFWAAIMIIEAGLSNRIFLLTGEATTLTLAAAGAEIAAAAVAGGLQIRHYQSDADGTVTIATAANVKNAFDAIDPTHVYYHYIQTVGLSHVGAFTSATSDPTNYTWMKSITRASTGVGVPATGSAFEHVYRLKFRGRKKYQYNHFPL